MLGHERGEGGGGRSVFGKMRGSVGEKGGGAVRSKGGEGGKAEGGSADDTGARISTY